jgi:CheY-like chemotaxis protein
MTSFRILHVDDESDIREVVQIALALDPQLITRSCSSGADAIAAATDFNPDLILCDVMMPVMDGPATLARLRENPATAGVPIIFMTARAQEKELTRFLSLGAIATIAKPFDPMSLAATLRRHLTSCKLAVASDGFGDRLRADRATLVQMRRNLQAGTEPSILEELQTCAHKLAGAAGIFGRQTVSDAASLLESAIIERRFDRGVPDTVEANLDVLIDCIDINVRSST